MRKIIIFAATSLSSAIFLFASLVLCLSASADSRRYHETGRLTSFSERAVTISERGYDVDASALIVNLADRPTPLAKLSLPAYVTFDYVYMKTAPNTMSPVIVYIKQIRQPVGNKRSTR